MYLQNDKQNFGSDKQIKYITLKTTKNKKILVSN